MNIEQEVQSVIEKKLEDGTIAKAIEEEFEKSIKNSVDDLFSRYGDVTKVLKKKIEEVMVERIESRDFSRYLVKFDTLLNEFIEKAAGENLKLAENFKGLLLEEPIEKIDLSVIYNKWKKHVAENVETDGLDTDSYSSYEAVEVKMKVEVEEERSWSSFRYATVYFECEHDEEMNLAIRLSCYKEKWDILHHGRGVNIRSLRGLGELEIFLMRLSQDDTEIVLDIDDEWDEVIPVKEPESSNC